MCKRIVQTNSKTIIELPHSNDCHFQQLFIAHAISIKEFVMGCQPIIVIDSSHMSGPYGAALLLTTTYDINDCMFSLSLDYEFKEL